MNRPTLKNNNQDGVQFQIRVILLVLLILLGFGTLTYRFYVLQISRHDFYHTQAESNRIGIAPVTPNRGLIVDRNGIVLAHNYTAYTLELRPDKIADLEETITEISQILPISPKEKRQFYKLKSESKNFETLPLKIRLTDEEIAKIAAQNYRFPGVEIKARLFREYPYKELTSHVIGYIGRINQAEEDKLAAEDKLANYRGTTHIGKNGLEQFYEDDLHGTTGVEEVETDSSGRAIRVLRRTAPVSGKTLHLSLDINLQQYADELFGDRRGALVAIDPSTGGVLAFISKPGYDPNLFIDGIDSQSWQELNSNPFRPLNNRALRGVYPPGSTFKPFMALAALEYGHRRPSDAIADPGFFSLPGSSHRFRDDKVGGHGLVDMYKSIAASCDTYYYRLAFDMGIDEIDRFMPMFGFGRQTGIDLPGEAIGVLPSPEWKKKRFPAPRYSAAQSKWYLGDVISIGIGQGYNAYTPLQLANATAILANGGVAFKPHLVNKVEDVKSHQLTQINPIPYARYNFKPENIAVIKHAMQGVMGPGGTGYAVSGGLQYTMAGKTGTAQVVGIKQGAKYNAATTKEMHRDHSWFIAFAPVEQPKIALAVLVENGGFGATAAAPIARKITDFYLLGKRATPVVETVASKGGKKPAPETTASEGEEFAHD
ncbi:penicillin-binding protein 2 [Leeia sp. TBRC 13508]|uniref:Peptidoglycan D,D-transpeptidase MrdA n=1 Tax=Leeia speluncae TaxID=2884804 RepID=A0ABS8D7D0_9NEIS|nr:penicillin-binding protein 2 [Leeia speluncae]MCB6184105.1 penicillin-binding protein 2 [Leeia speluncae]